MSRESYEFLSIENEEDLEQAFEELSEMQLEEDAFRKHIIEEIVRGRLTNGTRKEQNA